MESLLEWPWVHIRGQYWEEEVELVGKVEEIFRQEDGRSIWLKASGTPNESLLKYLSGVASKRVKIHLCKSSAPRWCGTRVTSMAENFKK